jgi:hypothetical protein
MRSYLVLAIAFGLCACASTAQMDNQATVQNAVYVVGDGMPQSQPIATADMQQSMEPEQPSKLMRLYWFFSGR